MCRSLGHKCLFYFDSFPPSNVILLRINTAHSFFLSFFFVNKIFSICVLIFLSCSLSICCPKSSCFLRCSLAFLSHFKTTAAPFHFPLKNVARNIRWFPEFFQQKHKFHSCCSSRKNESRNSYSQCCFRERGRERFLKCAMSVARASYPPQPGCSWVSYLFYISLGYSPPSLLLELSSSLNVSWEM